MQSLNPPPIPGWYDFPEHYLEMVDRFPSGSIFIEVGVWLGRSVIHLAEMVRASKKHIIIYAVDQWDAKAAGELEEDAKKMEDEGRPFYARFMENLKLYGVDHIVRPIRDDSAAAASRFPVADFVFIDADHSYESVHRDITAWLPVVRSGGVLAGHDYERETVARAVHEILGEDKIKLSLRKNTWIFEVP